jgi:uncharacterized protein (DUF433 family)
MLNLPRLEVPLVTGPDGRVRVEGTEVLLEQILDDFEGGSNAEEIVARHGQLRLSDVFLVLSFFLKKRKEVEDYLADQRQNGPQARPNFAA